jgi:molybdopterin molybdotransferase
MISVDEAVQWIVSAFAPLPSESVPLNAAAARVLAEDVKARLTQPPFPVSAMDGYAVRAADVAQVPTTLEVIGAAPAGHPFNGSVGPKQTVRIFTGGVVPEGADAIVIQEDTDQGERRVVIQSRAHAGRHIRNAGQDFSVGDILVRAGRRLGPRDLALLAAGDVAEVPVCGRPRILVAATGDELSAPGTPRKPGGIVASSVFGLCALIERWGGTADNLGILPDRTDSIQKIADGAFSADLVVTLGGVSVGDHDLIQQALGPKGFVLDFWKIAMRPGKPLIFGRLGKTPLLGLPGNPVSSYVCSLLFLKPAIAAMLGEERAADHIRARVAIDLPPNDHRQDYLRARLETKDGELWATPFPVQDSSMQRVLALADGLIVRPPHALAAAKGEPVGVIPLE